jgi:hypothetical protein
MAQFFGRHNPYLPEEARFAGVADGRNLKRWVTENNSTIQPQ